MISIKDAKKKLFTQKAIIIACAVSCVIRYIFAITQSGNINFAEDYAIAENIAKGLGFTYLPNVGATALKAPLYPYFLSVFILIFEGFAKIIVVLIQHTLFAAIPILLFRIGEELNYKKIGFVAAIIFLIHPSYFVYPNTLEITNLFVPMAVMWVYFAVRMQNEFTRKNVAIIGILSGLMILTQPIVIPIFITYILFIIIGRNYKNAMIIGAIVLAMVAPWTIRNYVEFNKVVVVKSPFWMNFYLGYLADNNGSKRFGRITQETVREIDSLRVTINDVVIEKKYKEIVVKEITGNTGLYVQKCIAQGILYWWVVPRYLKENGWRVMVGRKMPVLILNLLTLFGLVTLYKKNKKLALIIIFTLLYFTIVYAMTSIANTKYKLDIEWIQLFPASLPILRLFNKE